MTVDELISDEAKKDIILFGRNDVAARRIMRDSPSSDVRGYISAMSDCYRKMVIHFLDGGLSKDKVLLYSQRLCNIYEKYDELRTE